MMVKSTKINFLGTNSKVEILKGHWSYFLKRKKKKHLSLVSRRILCLRVRPGLRESE